MQTPVNPFKQALKAGIPQIGFWLTLTDSVAAEICAGAGFDWLLIDGEHAPHDLNSILGQLQTIAAYQACHAVVRVPTGNDVLIKQYLDLGAQTLLVPMVESAEQAAQIVQACRYPPAGIRGVGGSRAGRWGRYPRYLHESNEQVCVLVQVESQKGLENLDEIASVDGVDGVFIGPADLAASMGYPGDAGNSVVQAAILDAIPCIVQRGKAPGILTRDEAQVRQYLSLGALYVAVGIDSFVLAGQTSALAARFARQA